jgi:hypothetical protein
MIYVIALVHVANKRSVNHIHFFFLIFKNLFFLTVNCVDRHKEKDASRLALIWEKDEPGQEERITYG